MPDIYYDDSPNGVAITDEPIQIKPGKIYLKHHHDSNNVPMNVTIYTQLGKQGTQIGGFTVGNDTIFPYLKYIEFSQGTIDANPNNPTVYANYTGTGQYLNAALINGILQDIADLKSGAPVNQAPSIPIGLNATSITTSGFRLNWGASTDGEGEAITYRVFKDGVQYSVPTSNLYMDIVGQTADSSANWTVTAIDAANHESLPSDQLLVTINTVSNNPPSVPTGLASSNITATGFRLSWTASTDGEGDTPVTYQVYKGGVAYGSPTSNTYLDITGQTSGSVANWTVSAIDSGSRASNQSSALQVQLTNMAPTASPTISGTTTVGSVLTINPNYSDNESDLAGTHIYKMYRDSQTSGDTKSAITGATSNLYTVVEADVARYLFGGVVPKATSGTLTGVEAFSTGLLIPVPAPPSLNGPAVGNQQTTHTWTPNATLATETYNLLWKAGSAPTQGSYDGKLTNVTPGVVHQYINQTGQADGSGTKLTNDTVTYYYALEMVVNGVPSVLSSVVSAVPSASVVILNELCDDFTTNGWSKDSGILASGGQWTTQASTGSYYAWKALPQTINPATDKYLLEFDFTLNGSPGSSEVMIGFAKNTAGAKPSGYTDDYKDRICFNAQVNNATSSTTTTSVGIDGFDGMVYDGLGAGVAMLLPANQAVLGRRYTGTMEFKADGKAYFTVTDTVTTTTYSSNFTLQPVTLRNIYAEIGYSSSYPNGKINSFKLTKYN